MGWLTKTMATVEDFARFAAAAVSVPSIYLTEARGDLAWMFFCGEEGK
jgi:hypothetical protein